jgi:hypothetical protein
MSERDEWREQLALRLLGATAAVPSDFSPTDATALEIAFGRVRSEVTYVLEFARAHGLPATGSVIGDDVSLRLGENATHFRIQRRERCITAMMPGRGDERLTWNAEKRTMVDGEGRAIEMKPFAREAIDTVINGWRASSPVLNPRTATVRDLPVTKSDPPPPLEEESPRARKE